MKRMAGFIATLFLLAALLGGCGQIEQREKGEGVQVVTSISILGDIAANIVGEQGTVEFIIPVGDNPEDYELLPSEVQKMNDADIVFLNGHGLEETIDAVIHSVTDTPVIHVTAGVETISLVGEDVPDPHAWFDTKKVEIYAENMANALIELDPEGKDIYLANLKHYKEELSVLDEWIRVQTAKIPQSNRVIVISENAMKYFGAAYGFETEGIWELNSHEEGTPQQISRIVDLVIVRKLPALFLETTIDPRYMEMISSETGVPISGLLYTDALGKKGSGAETYIDMMKYNVTVLLEGLM